MKYLIRCKHLILDHIRCLYYVIFNEKHKFNMRRFRECDNLKPKSQIKSELMALKDFWGCIPMQYYTHDFYSADCTLSLEEMKNYIPGYYFYKVLYPHYDDIAYANAILEDKSVMNCLFTGLGFPQSQILFLKKGNVLFDAQGSVVNQERFDDVIGTLNCDKIFIKPINGRGGKGILIAKYCVDGIYTVANKPLSHLLIKELAGNYVIEPSIKQIDYIDKIYPHSVNTLRAITKRDDNGKITLIGMTLRMGNSGREIDNGSAGGFLIGINLETGTAIRDYASYNYGIEKFVSHPDTDFVFSELQIPDWNNIKEQILGFAQQFVFLDLVGWDIAITEHGALVIEANTYFGIDHLQAGLGGIRKDFIQCDPKKYLYM
ncbi:hypothetical protein L4D76_20830 [Photobacterium sagamiensis]|uniref:sugar-transfer associated ATP-grasp domain-containing protein n=1 Tax=Photobacterium sagamiensis TaxID=2910241 RepID=UPI003D09BFE8